MALTSKQRNALPTKDFAGPDRSYPIPPGDVSHAVNAKARATQAVKAGRMSARLRAHIDEIANAVIRSKGR